MARLPIRVTGVASIQQTLDKMSRGLRGDAAGQMAYQVGKVVEAQTKLHLSNQYLRVGTQKGGKSSGRRLRESFATMRRGRASAVVGTPTVYAAVHEYGLNVGQYVRSHTRTNRRTGKQYRVNQFTRMMRQKERRYFRDAMVRSQAEQARAIKRAYAKLTGQA